MKTAILSILLFGCVIVHAQTKVISHKSHSGSNSSFAKAYQNNLFDINHSNFGLHETKVVKLDTVIAISNSITVIKYRESRKVYYVGTKYQSLDDSAFIKKTDTLKNHSIFNKKHTVIFIKNSKKEFYNTPLDEVVFIGFKKK